MSRHEITMPDIGEGVTEAEITDWNVKVGDPVKRYLPALTVLTLCTTSAVLSGPPAEEDDEAELATA